MSQAKDGLDKNLSNVVKDLDKTAVTSHQAQQIQQDTNDRRHQDALNHDKTEDLSHPHS
jgi:predicted DNA binding CopG/RHH family protein